MALVVEEICWRDTSVTSSTHRTCSGPVMPGMSSVALVDALPLGSNETSLDVISYRRWPDAGKSRRYASSSTEKPSVSKGRKYANERVTESSARAPFIGAPY